MTLPPNDPMAEPAVWAYKADDESGRIVNIGSHPEAITQGERLDLTEACFLYALDGAASPIIKGTLVNGVTRRMDKSTQDDDPAHTRIGDRQYHHFTFDVDEDGQEVTVQLAGQSGIDFHLYLREGGLATSRNASHAKTGNGSEKRIETQLASGTWFVSVECVSSVTAMKDKKEESFVYSGKTEVLNGAAYEITVTQVEQE